MGVVPLIRQVVLGVTTLFSLIVLALSGSFISQASQDFRLYATFSGLGVAVGLISLLTLPVMLVIDILRRGALTSMVVVEVAWLYFLTILWLATAGEAASTNILFFPVGCNFATQVENSLCQEAQAIEAFSFLNFITIFLYAGAIIVLAVMAASRGEGVWLSSVKESFDTLAIPGQYPMTQYGSSAQPQTTPAPVASQQTGAAAV